GPGVVDALGGDEDRGAVRLRFEPVVGVDGAVAAARGDVVRGPAPPVEAEDQAVRVAVVVTVGDLQDEAAGGAAALDRVRAAGERGCGAASAAGVRLLRGGAVRGRADGEGRGHGRDHGEDPRSRAAARSQRRPRVSVWKHGGLLTRLSCRCGVWERAERPAGLPPAGGRPAGPSSVPLRRGSGDGRCPGTRGTRSGRVRARRERRSPPVSPIRSRAPAGHHRADPPPRRPDASISKSVYKDWIYIVKYWNIYTYKLNFRAVSGPFIGPMTERRPRPLGPSGNGPPHDSGAVPLLERSD